MAAERCRGLEKEPNNQIGLFQKLWLNTSFLSLDDVGQVGVDIMEFFERSQKRRKADHAAQLGMALFNGTDISVDSPGSSSILSGGTPHSNFPPFMASIDFSTKFL